MLEPLIVLTVLNCFFMFSSTVTTCALWWQYRYHRCCFRKAHCQNGVTIIPKRSRSSGNTHVNEKSTTSKLNGVIDITDTNKTFKSASREVRKKQDKKKKSRGRRSKTNFYYPEYNKKHKNTINALTEPININPADVNTKMSEASQTTNDKSTVVMEFSTVQKVMQIIDNGLDISIPRLTVITKKEAKDMEKDLDVENKFENNVTKADKP